MTSNMIRAWLCLVELTFGWYLASFYRDYLQVEVKPPWGVQTSRCWEAVTSVGRQSRWPLHTALVGSSHGQSSKERPLEEVPGMSPLIPLASCFFFFLI